MTPGEVAKRLLRIARRVRRDKTLTPSARLVAEDILDRIDWKLGYKSLSQEFLSRELGLDVRTVRQATKEITSPKRNYFRRTKHGKHYRYWPVVPWSGEADNDVTIAQTSPNAANAVADRSPEKNADDPGRNARPKSGENVPESTSKNPRIGNHHHQHEHQPSESTCESEPDWPPKGRPIAIGEATAIAEEAARLAGYGSIEEWPAKWHGFPAMIAAGMREQGWTRDDVLIGVRIGLAAAALQGEPPRSCRYFAWAIAKAQAERIRPLPVARANEAPTGSTPVQRDPVHVSIEAFVHYMAPQLLLTERELLDCVGSDQLMKLLERFEAGENIQVLLRELDELVRQARGR